LKQLADSMRSTLSGWNSEFQSRQADSDFIFSKRRWQNSIRKSFIR